MPFHLSKTRPNKRKLGERTEIFSAYEVLHQGSYPILPPPRAIPCPIPTIPKPDLPVENGDPGPKTGYSFTLRVPVLVDRLTQKIFVRTHLPPWGAGRP